MNRHVMHVVVICMVVGCTFAGSVGNGFVWDDAPVVVKNELFTGSHGFLDVIRAEDTFREYQQSTGYYRPLPYLSFYLDSLLWGMNPVGFHVTNLLLHIMVSLALYELFVSFYSRRRFVLVAALLFALNPVTIEAVCFIAGGRNTLLCTLFVLLALLMHRKGHGTLAVLCTFGAVASKEFGVLVPVLLLCHDGIFGEKVKGLGAYLPHLLPIALLLVLRSLVVAGGSAFPSVTMGSLLLSPELMLRYLGIILLPFLHKVAYTLAMPQALSFRFFLALAGCGCLALATYRLRSNRGFLFGLAWFLLFLLPGLFIASRYKIQMADRHAYLPAIGLVLALGSLLKERNDQIAVWSSGILLAGFACMSFAGSGVWKSNATLFQRMIADEPLLDTGYTGLGQHYLDTGKLEEGLTWIDRGAAAGAVPERVAGNIRLNMLTSHGETLAGAGNEADAERMFRQALHLDQDFVPALIDLGGLLARRGDSDGAIRYFLRAAELQPQNPVPHFNLSEAYRMRHDLPSAEKALGEYRRLSGEK